MARLTRVASGAIRRVNGPLVEVAGLDDVAMDEVVHLGPDVIPGEVVAVADGVVTVQAYEYTGGLAVGVAVERTREPLSARLGPHLLGGVFDGLLRPLDTAPRWLNPRRQSPNSQRLWTFQPQVTAGTTAAPGLVVGTVATAGAVVHRVLVPSRCEGQITLVAEPGGYDGDAVVARVGDIEIRIDERWPIRRPRRFASRSTAVDPLHTGQRVLDLLFPMRRGSATAVPGGFGTGKTVLLQQIAKWCDADVIVYVGCGERGNEMADVLADLSELTDPQTGGRLVDRTVILANTSNMPMMAREASVYSAITVAEYFRDMGYHVVVIADSTSRWAEALREFASRTGALPAEEGYPADLASALAAFYERAGLVETLAGTTGSVTVVGAVSPPGGDLAEPVTTATQRFVQSVWVLDRDLAYSRHYPAVSWSGSFSHEVSAIGAWYAEHGDPDWAGRRARTAALLAEADRLTALADVVGATTLPGRERMVMLGGRLLRDAVLMQNALSENDASCPLAKGAALLQGVLDVIDACLAATHRGVPATEVEEFDFSQLVRLRDECGPGDVDAVRLGCRRVVEELEVLT